MACTCTTLPSSRNRVRVRAHPRRIVGGTTAVGAHARNRVQRTAARAKHDVPPKTFRSASGRVFAIGRKNESSHYPLSWNGQEVGQLWPTTNYGLRPDGRMKWSASLTRLVWSDMPPTGLGFDVAGLDTPQEALAAIARNADDVIDWREGKPVRSIYAGGRMHMKSGQKAGVFQRNRSDGGLYPGRPRAFEGINHNEKMFSSVQPGLVEILLSGVQGISTPVPGYEFRMVPRDFAERTLEKAQNVLSHFVAQRKVPRGARFWMDSHRAKLRDLYSRARRVYEGGPPKMTLADYHALDDYLRVPHRG